MRLRAGGPACAPRVGLKAAPLAAILAGISTWAPRVSAAGVSFGVNPTAHCVQQGLYLDPARLECAACGANQQVAASGDRCECNANSIVTSTTVREPRGAVNITCTPCAAGEQVSFDGLSCVPCPGGNCACASTEVNRTRGGTGMLAQSQCLACDTGFGAVAGGQPGQCTPCAYDDMDSGCAACPNGTTARGIDCISDSVTAQLPASSAYAVRFDGVGTGVVDSTLLRDRLPGAYLNCLSTSGANRTACQQLANLCSLQLYADTLGSQTSCTLYKQIVAQNSSSLHGFPGWPLELPWLYYDAGSFPTAAEDVNLKGTFSHGTARDGSTVPSLEFVVNAFFLNGTFAGAQNVTTQFELCPPLPPITGLAWTWFGTTYDYACGVTLTSGGALAGGANTPFAEPLFYEPFLVDYTSDGSPLLYPVPVTVSGVSGYVRRFFLFDNVTAAGQSTHAVRVATSVSLFVKMRSGGDGKIYPPVLSVGYGAFDATNGGDTQSVGTSFSVTYTDDHDDFGSTFEVAVTVLGVAAAGMAYLRTRSDRERDRRVDAGLRVLTTFAYEWARYFSTLMYMALGLTGVVFLVMANRDSAAYTTPPNDSQDDEFELWLIVAVSFKIVQAVYTVYQQSSVDVFFIDWEDDTAGGGGGGGGGAPGAAAGGGKQPSVWRTLFVANEFHELGVIRKVPYQFLVLSVLFFWYVAGADDLASRNPPSDKHDYDGGTNKVLRFGVAALLFTSLYVGMWLYHNVIHVRFIADPFGAFQDLCALSNISVIVFTHDCRGFYLHGMSPHGPAEVPLTLMTKQLEEEAEDLGRRRGLVENSDDQVFEIHIQESVRNEYAALLDEVGQAQRQGGRGTSWKVDEKQMAVYNKLNRFFKAYLTHSYSGKDWIVREKSNLERWVMATPAVEDTAVFFPDRFGSFCEIFILGQEGAIFIFEFFVFALTDWFTENFVGAAAATILCTIVIHQAHQSLCKDNLARKTLVNKCFLI